MEIAIALVSSITTLAVCLVNNYFQMKRMRVEQKQITESQLESIKLGVQSLLRDRLLWEYEKWEDRGYCPYDKKQNIENMHTQYANLGKNGVMDEAHAHFMKIPLEPPATNN